MTTPRPAARPLPQNVSWTFVFRVIGVSSVIGVLIDLMEGGSGALWRELVISNTIGLCIWGTVHLLIRLSRGRMTFTPAALISVPVGVVIGGKAATLFGVDDLIARWANDPLHQWQWIVLSLLFAVSATLFLVVSSRAAEYRLELEAERRRSAEAGRAQVVAELAMLQAQIEPHFLFNTLAHVQSAIDQDPALGKAVLEHLIQYLRGALRRSRQTQVTLREERELVEPLLAIAAIRLGSRLRFEIVLPAALEDWVLPPLLLQPLVENALKHGIEPSIGGGCIVVAATVEGDLLVLRVSDTGVGLKTHAPEGIGLSNVRQRLSSLYGDKGRLTLQQNAPQGLIAELRLPRQRMT